MRIRLPSFNNPNLPMVPRRGFIDLFDRAESDDIGRTNNNIPWEIHTRDGYSIWGTTGRGTARLVESYGQNNHLVAEGGSTDGTLTTTFELVDRTNTNRGGLTMCFDELNSYIGISAFQLDDDRLRVVESRSDGAYSVGDRGPSLNSGDKLTAVKSGRELTVLVNDIVVMEHTLTQDFPGTKHGLYGHKGGTNEHSRVEFTPR